MRANQTKKRPQTTGSRRIAPRLLGAEGGKGPAREQLGNGLPPPVKAWIKMKAEQEGKSASFWLEEQILDHVYPAKERKKIRYIAPKKKPLLFQRKAVA